MIYSILYELRVFSDEIAKVMQFELAPGGYLLFLITSLISELAIFALYYTFRSIGLYKMAKNTGICKPAMALIPFYGIYVANKLSPDSKYIKKNNVFYILAIVAGALTLLANVLLDAFYGIYALVQVANGKILTYTMLGTNTIWAKFLIRYLNLASLAFAVFMLIVYRSLFMSYTMKNVTTYVVLSALVYAFTNSLLLAGIFIFAIRNKPRINYDEYFEARRNWAQRAQNGYGGNPYGNPYDRYYQSGSQYGNNPYNSQNGNYGQKPDVDPFEEFSSNSSSNTNNSSDSDDFFN